METRIGWRNRWHALVSNMLNPRHVAIGDIRFNIVFLYHHCMGAGAEIESKKMELAGLGS
jgi:hypothetical protein